MIKISQEGRIDSYTALMPVGYHGIERKGPFHIEMKCKLDERVHEGSLLIVVDIHNGNHASQRKRWSGTIRFSPYGHAFAKVGRNHPDEAFVELYRSSEIPIIYGQWYDLGIYADPSEMRFRFFMDGQELGEYVIDEARGVLPDPPTYQALVGVANWGSNRKDRMIGYIDEICVKEGR